uniref:Uncharacterized protein n=1 Tax=Trypanosoma vivax (strain Y486) TaxID=1055687 RepID=G0UCE0_TRYVY|nr:conserved hypothetical protein, fragment [Trypanosoma vivax Y486]
MDVHTERSPCAYGTSSLKSRTPMETTFTSAGRPITEFSLTCNENFISRSHDKREVLTFSPTVGRQTMSASAGGRRSRASGMHTADSSEKAMQSDLQRRLDVVHSSLSMAEKYLGIGPENKSSVPIVERHRAAVEAEVAKLILLVGRHHNVEMELQRVLGRPVDISELPVYQAEKRSSAHTYTRELPPSLSLEKLRQATEELSRRVEDERAKRGDVPPSEDVDALRLTSNLNELMWLLDLGDLSTHSLQNTDTEVDGVLGPEAFSSRGSVCLDKHKASSSAYTHKNWKMSVCRTAASSETTTTVQSACSEKDDDLARFSVNSDSTFLCDPEVRDLKLLQFMYDALIPEEEEEAEGEKDRSLSHDALEGPSSVVTDSLPARMGSRAMDDVVHGILPLHVRRHSDGLSPEGSGSRNASILHSNSALPQGDTTGSLTFAHDSFCRLMPPEALANTDTSAGQMVVHPVRAELFSVLQGLYGDYDYSYYFKCIRPKGRYKSRAGENYEALLEKRMMQREERRKQGAQRKMDDTILDSLSAKKQGSFRKQSVQPPFRVDTMPFSPEADEGNQPLEDAEEVFSGEPVEEEPAPELQPPDLVADEMEEMMQEQGIVFREEVGNGIVFVLKGRRTMATGTSSVATSPRVKEAAETDSGGKKRQKSCSSLETSPRMQEQLFDDYVLYAMNQGNESVEATVKIDKSKLMNLRMKPIINCKAPEQGISVKLSPTKSQAVLALKPVKKGRQVQFTGVLTFHSANEVEERVDVERSTSLSGRFPGVSLQRSHGSSSKTPTPLGGTSHVLPAAPEADDETQCGSTKQFFKIQPCWDIGGGKKVEQSFQGTGGDDEDADTNFTDTVESVGSRLGKSFPSNRSVPRFALFHSFDRMDTGEFSEDAAAFHTEGGSEGGAAEVVDGDAGVGHDNVDVAEANGVAAVECASERRDGARSEKTDTADSQGQCPSSAMSGKTPLGRADSRTASRAGRNAAGRLSQSVSRAEGSPQAGGVEMGQCMAPVEQWGVAPPDAEDDAVEKNMIALSILQGSQWADPNYSAKESVERDRASGSAQCDSPYEAITLSGRRLRASDSASVPMSGRIVSDGTRCVRGASEGGTTEEELVDQLLASSIAAASTYQACPGSENGVPEEALLCILENIAQEEQLNLDALHGADLASLPAVAGSSAAWRHQQALTGSQAHSAVGFSIPLHDTEEGASVAVSGATGTAQDYVIGSQRSHTSDLTRMSLSSHQRVSEHTPGHDEQWRDDCSAAPSVVHRRSVSIASSDVQKPSLLRTRRGAPLSMTVRGTRLSHSGGSLGHDEDPQTRIFGESLTHSAGHSTEDLRGKIERIISGREGELGVASPGGGLDNIGMPGAKKTMSEVSFEVTRSTSTASRSVGGRAMSPEALKNILEKVSKASSSKEAAPKGFMKLEVNGEHLMMRQDQELERDQQSSVPTERRQIHTQRFHDGRVAVYAPDSMGGQGLKRAVSKSEALGKMTRFAGVLSSHATAEAVMESIVGDLHDMARDHRCSSRSNKRTNPLDAKGGGARGGRRNSNDPMNRAGTVSLPVLYAPEAVEHVDDIEYAGIEAQELFMRDPVRYDCVIDDVVKAALRKVEREEMLAKMQLGDHHKSASRNSERGSFRRSTLLSQSKLCVEGMSQASLSVVDMGRGFNLEKGQGKGHRSRSTGQSSQLSLETANRESSQTSITNDIQRIVDEQQRAKKIVSYVLAEMRRIWRLRTLEGSLALRAAVDRFVFRSLLFTWRVERRRVLNLNKLISLLDRKSGRAKGWVPFYSKDSILTDHYTWEPVPPHLSHSMRVVHRAMCLARQQHLLPLRVVRSQVCRQISSHHLMYGYSKQLIRPPTHPAVHQRHCRRLRHTAPFQRPSKMYSPRVEREVNWPRVWNWPPHDGVPRHV